MGLYASILLENEEEGEKLTVPLWGEGICGDRMGIEIGVDADAGAGAGALAVAADEEDDAVDDDDEVGERGGDG